MTILIPGIYGLDAAAAWQAFTKNPQKYIDKVAQDKSVQKEISYFNSKAPKFTSVDDLLKDRRALQYLLNAYGLGSELKNLGRIKKILTEDPTKTDSLVNKLVDPRFKTMATSLRLDQGMTNLQRLSFRDVLQDKYVRDQLESALGSQDNTLREAAYFARNSNGISSVYNILGDSILRDVVQGAFQLPSQMAIQPVETQARVILSRVDIKKFAQSDAASKFNSTTLLNAQNDHSAIEKDLAISDAARTQVKTVQDILDQLVTDYGALDTITDPVGSNAATIALQQTSVPQVIGFEQELNASQKSMSSISSLLSTLSDLVTQAQDPNNTLADLKSQFDAIVTALNNKFSAASVTLPDGTSGNLLLNGANDTVSAVLTDTGKTVTINRYDTSGLQNYITNAQNAFAAITSSSDESNILTAQSALFVAIDQATTVSDSIATDITNLQSTTSSTVFAATLNTTAILQGQQSVDDGLSRIAQIEDLLTKIDDLAKTAQSMSDTDDHSALEASFLDYRTQIRDLITTPGTGLDNLLNNSPDTNYTISAGNTVTAHAGYDLLSSIADVLDAGSLSTQADAAILRNTTIQVTTGSDGLKAKLTDDKKIFDRIVSVYDPRAKLDAQVYALQNSIESIVSSAAVNGANLLDASQSDIKLLGLSSGVNLTFTAQTNFLSSVQSGLSDIIAQFGNGTSSIYSAVHSLSSTVDSVKMSMDMENRRATMEYGRAGAVIDALTPKTTADTNTDYKTNAFTQKFLIRYLTLNAQNNKTPTGGNSFVLNLYNTSTNAQGFPDFSSAFSALSSLSLQV